ncbi:tyrosine-type recombinase/integrase, partial [Fusobacterium polymorphum]
LGVKISAHGLRHSHATMLIRNLVPIQLVQKRLGHADPALTIATYTHLISEDEKIIVDLLEKI